MSLVAEEISTQRLLLRPWRVDDAESALAIYGEADVSHWLSPGHGQCRGSRRDAAGPTAVDG